MGKEKSSETKTASGLVPVYIPHHGIEAIEQKIETEDGLKKVYSVYGSINGIPFEVECDKHVLVEPHVAEVLQGVINQ